MRPRTVFAILALGAAAVWCASAVFSGDAEPAAKPESQEGADSQPAADAESQIEVFVRHAMRGQEHKLLDRMTGSWQTAVKYWMTPDTPAVESQGSCERKWILGGRFLQEEFDGGSLALPFRGLGLYGYDRFEGKYTSAWMDTMSTAIMTNLGVYDEAGDVVNFVGQYGDPWTGTKKKSRGLTRFVSDDRHVLELYEQKPGGRDFKFLEITYTRKPAPATRSSS